jgi:carbon storage regulator
MLVLSRKSGEAIKIGDDITLTVVSVKGKRVRLGIEAPSDCRIVRDEVLEDSLHRVAELIESVDTDPQLVTC